MSDGATFLTGDNPYEHRVERSFAFVDLSGFTHYTDTKGDGAAVEVLSKFRTWIREISARRGVRIAKWLGDGAMLVSVDPEAITEAIVDIETAGSESPLALRAGVASGPVILFEGDDYIGRAVNLAARLCDQAEPGQILAPAEMITTLMVNIRGKDAGERQIPGLDQPIKLVSLEARGI